MSFDVGKVSVRCPQCGAAVIVEVQAIWVTRDEAKNPGFGGRTHSTVTATLRETNTVPHDCQETA